MIDSVGPIFLSVEDVLSLHEDQIRLFGGSAGIRDAGALESAVATPACTFDGTFLHENPFEMAAAYAFHIAENQPFGVVVTGEVATGLAVSVSLAHVLRQTFICCDSQNVTPDARRELDRTRRLGRG